MVHFTLITCSSGSLLGAPGQDLVQNCFFCYKSSSSGHCNFCSSGNPWLGSGPKLFFFAIYCPLRETSWELLARIWSKIINFIINCPLWGTSWELLAWIWSKMFHFLLILCSSGSLLRAPGQDLVQNGSFYYISSSSGHLPGAPGQDLLFGKSLARIWSKIVFFIIYCPLRETSWELLARIWPKIINFIINCLF